MKDKRLRSLGRRSRLKGEETRVLRDLFILTSD